MFDYTDLIDQIKRKYITQAAFAKALGIGRVSLNLRLNNKADFRNKEINKACELLEIKKNEIPRYFFRNKVQKHELY